jgi:hypothetical protein
MARQVGEECVMLDTAHGTYFGLDPVGARMWQLLGEGRTLLEVCDRMVEEYEVSRVDIERDVIRLVSELGESGLLTLRD